MTEFLSDEQPTRINTSDDECVRRVGELQNVLIHVSQPLRDSPSPLVVDPSIHEAFTIALDKRFKILEAEILCHKIQPRSKENLAIFSRLLQFILSFKSILTPKLKEIYSSFSRLFFRFALVGLT